MGNTKKLYFFMLTTVVGAFIIFMVIDLSGSYKDYHKVTEVFEEKLNNDIVDEEILNLITKAHNSLMKVLDNNYVESPYTLENGSYIALPPELDSYNKLYDHLNKYWTSDATDKLIKFIDAKFRNGVYSRILGEIGLGYFNVYSAEIADKKVQENRITVYIKGTDASEEVVEYRAELVYTEGHWKVDYWQWAFELLQR